MVVVKEAKKYQAFYTKSTPIVDYMVKMLMLKTSDKVLEPCGGDGVFVEAILKINESANIDVCELNDIAYRTLSRKFESPPNVNIRQCDTILDDDLILSSGFGGVYDKIIANPPYGAWQDMDKRAALKKAYPNLYTKETYTLFLYRCIELLKDGGSLTFIIPDTFLNLHSHKAIRQHLLTKTKIVELALFPSSFFPGVNFGYANLSIITLQKCSDSLACLDNQFAVINSFTQVEQLLDTNAEGLKVFTYTQKEIYTNPDHSFLITGDTRITDTINKTNLKIGDIANCVTGFYSGDDKTFLKAISHDLKNGKNYGIVDTNAICSNYKTLPNILEGIEGKNHYIPIVKGGNTKYLKPESWFMTWSKEAVSHYKKDKKARFQNPKYYFKSGIGVPMISSSSITASLIENKLFDQSIVGIFPNDPALTNYLLAFFNSPTCNKLIRTINPSANNPANYIKKIPFIYPTAEQLAAVDAAILAILEGIRRDGCYDLGLDEVVFGVFEEVYGF
jgi:adenine-specific DNA-methyltransferase